MKLLSTYFERSKHIRSVNKFRDYTCSLFFHVIVNNFNRNILYVEASFKIFENPVPESRSTSLKMNETSLLASMAKQQTDVG